MSLSATDSGTTLREMMQSASTLLLARWILKNLDWSGGNSDENGEFVASILEEHARQVRAAVSERPAIPEGWKLVPCEPTDSMIQAAHNAPAHGHPETGCQRYDEIYLAMLDAAPSEGEQR